MKDVWNMTLFLAIAIVLTLPKCTANASDERFAKLERLITAQSLQLLEQSQKIEVLENKVSTQHNDLKVLTEQLVGVQETNRAQNADISALKKTLTTCLRAATKNPDQPKHGSLHVDVDTRQELPKRSNIQNGPVDIAPMPIMQKLSTHIKRNLNGRAIVGHTAFYAYMSKQEAAPGKHHTLIFDVIKTNINNGYSHYTGTFMAPVKGTYVFTFSIRRSCGSYGAFQFVHNANIAGSFYNRDLSYCQTLTGTVVLSIEQGDVVFIRTHGTATFTGNIESDDTGRSTFCGWSV